jgi:hypothetical protein
MEEDELMAQTAAGQIWPNLAQGTPNEVAHRRTPSMADAIFPSLSREAKAGEAELAWVEARNKRNRDSLLRGLRETLAAVRADKARGR